MPEVPCQIGCPITGDIAAPEVEPTATWVAYPTTTIAEAVPALRDIDATMAFTTDLGTCDIRPLLHLDGHQLIALRTPNVSSHELWNAVQSQLTSQHDRHQLFVHQGALYADDEIRFHIQDLVLRKNQACLSGAGGFHMSIDPLLMSAWVEQLSDFGIQFLSQVGAHLMPGTSIVTAVDVQGHWIPLQFLRVKDTLYIFTWDEPSVSHAALGPLYRAAQHAFNCQATSIHRVQRAFFTADCCGALAIAFLHHVLLGTPLPTTEQMAMSFHATLKTRFEMHLSMAHTCPRPWIWAAGPADATQQALANVLTQHGVPEDQASSRAAQAIKALGIGAIEIALKHRSPWKQLKTVGTQHKFQFLLPSELQDLIEKNKLQAVGKKSTKVRQSRKKTSAPEITLDPTKLAIVEGTFRCGAHIIPQIQLNQIGPAATGVVLSTVDDIQPYLRGNTKVSTEPFAVAVLGDVSQVISTLNQCPVVVPCTCLANKEPILVEATLFQLGSIDITKHTAVNPITLPSIDVSTVKFVFFRDEVGEDWKQVSRAPIRFLVATVPCLRLCNAMDCSCNAWHNIEGLDVQDPVLDVWRRQFLQFGFKPCGAQDADMYSVCLRVPECLLDRLIRGSGGGGIYVEPRSGDGKFVDEEFAVVWAPKLSKAELVHVRQTHPGALGLARLGERRGLRTKRADAEKIHEVLRPGTTYLPSGPKHQFLAGPFPYGASRQAISEAFAKLKWIAKAVHPMNPVQSTQSKGNMWLLHSAEQPPGSVFQMGHGEVVVTVHKSPQPNAQTAIPKPVAAKATLDLCGAKTKIGEDLLQVYDPWKKPSEWQAQPSQLPNAAEALSQFEARLEKSILSKIQVGPQDMVQDDLPERMQELETKLQNITIRQQTMEQNMADSSAHHATQLNHLQQQFSAQAQQLNGKIENQQQNIQAMFDSQMSQIRSLLSKRSHPDSHEWRCGGETWKASFSLVRLICPLLMLTIGLCNFLSLTSFFLGLVICFCVSIQFCVCQSTQDSTRVSAPSSRCRSTKFQFASPKGSRLRWVQLFLFWLCVQVRIGEALHPGPESKERDLCICHRRVQSIRTWWQSSHRSSPDGIWRLVVCCRDTPLCQGHEPIQSRPEVRGFKP